MLTLKSRRRDYHGVHTDPARFKKQERTGKFKKFLRTLYLLIIFITLIWLVYFVFYSPIFKVNDVIISGNQSIASDEIKNIINKDLSKKSYWLLPNDTYLTIPIKKIRADLNNNFFLASLNVTKKFPHRLYISLREKLAGFNFCIEDKEKCYHVNYDGLVTNRVGNNELNLSNIPTVFFRLPPKKEKPLGESATTTADFNSKIEATTTKEIKIELPKITIKETKLPLKIVRFILDLFENFNQKIKLGNIKDIEINDLEAYTKKIIIYTKEGYQIYFNPDLSLNEQLNNLNVILIKKIKGDSGGLEYIDLRFGEKVYYK